MKLQLVWINRPCCVVKVPHYDLCTDEKKPCNIACIATDKAGAKQIRKWIRLSTHPRKGSV
jgi:hypothetical protein